MSRGPGRRADAGFTLAELLLVVGILAVLAAIAVPRFAGLRGSWEFEESTRLLIADLRLARGEALRHGGAVEVDFHPDHYEVVLHRPFETAASPDFADRAGVRGDDGEEIVLLRRPRPRETRWFPPDEPIRFEPGGNANGGVVRIVNDELASGFLVTVDPVLGDATVETIDDHELASGRLP